MSGLSATQWGFALPRLIKKSRTPFASFLGAAFSLEAPVSSDPDPRSSVWPMPLPYAWRDEVAPPRSRRVQQRRAWMVARRRMTNLVVMGLDSTTSSVSSAAGHLPQ